METIHALPPSLPNLPSIQTTLLSIPPAAAMSPQLHNVCSHPDAIGQAAAAAAAAAAASAPTSTILERPCVKKPSVQPGRASEGGSERGRAAGHAATQPGNNPQPSVRPSTRAAGLRLRRFSGSDLALSLSLSLSIFSQPFRVARRNVCLDENKCPPNWFHKSHKNCSRFPKSNRSTLIWLSGLSLEICMLPFIT